MRSVFESAHVVLPKQLKNLLFGKEAGGATFDFVVIKFVGHFAHLLFLYFVTREYHTRLV